VSAASRAALLALAALLLPATALGAKKGKARPQKADSRARGVVTLAGQRLMSATEHGPDQPRANEPTTAVFALGTQLGGVASVGVRFPPWVKGGAGGFYPWALRYLPARSRRVILPHANRAHLLPEIPRLRLGRPPRLAAP
jgi:hypothetical protein